jgi:sugar lactone lactonase YvrE
MLAAMACATPARRPEAPVYFPPAPELPRIQFLVSIKGLKDVEQQSGFNRFVVGERQDVRLDKPYGVAMHDGRIYVCDTNASVVVFDLKAKRYGPMPGAAGPGRLVQPVNISIDAYGTKYVADPGRGQVVTFDRDDAYQNAYGTPGAWRPVDAVAWEDRIYVADPANGLVKVFDKTTGEPVRSFGDAGEPQERLDRPTNLAFDKDGYLYVTDAGRFQVIKFDRDGHFKSTFGQPGDNLGHFARPKGIALDRDGRLLMFFGEGGESPGQLLLPAKVSIDYDDVPYFQQYAGPQFRIEYLLLVTSQFGERSISVFGYGQASGQKYPTDDELLKAIDERRKREQPPPSPP